MTDNPIAAALRAPFQPCPKCDALQDVALLCGSCADRFCDHLMADPAFAATMAAWEARNIVDRAVERLLDAKPAAVEQEASRHD